MPSQLLWGINLSFERLSPCKRQIIYVLRTRAPVASDIATLLPLDLHVLGLPLAFILSQDQTLHCKVFLHDYLSSKYSGNYYIIVCYAF